MSRATHALLKGASKGFWRDRNVLVTGGAGLLGGHVADQLSGAGANVSVLVRDLVPMARLYREGPNVNLVQGDQVDHDAVERALGEYEAETLIHLGAQAIVGVANRNPVSTFESNIRGTWAVLEAARRSPLVRRIVVASSDKAYGEHKDLPYVEDVPLRGRYPYDVSKSCADLIAQSYHHTFGMPVSITRCGNLFGPGDLNYSRLIPGTIKAYVRGEAPEIRSDGKPVRDYLYVEDGAAAVLRLAEAMDQKSHVGQAYNFSNEEPKTVLEIVALIRRIMGGRGRLPKVRGVAKNEIGRQFLSAQKAKRDLGWAPSFSLEEGLRRTVEWYRRHLGGETND